MTGTNATASSSRQSWKTDMIRRFFPSTLDIGTDPIVKVGEIKSGRWSLVGRPCAVCGGIVAFGREPHSQTECDMEHVRRTMES